MRIPLLAGIGILLSVSMTGFGQTASSLENPRTINAFRTWVRSAAIPIGSLEPGSYRADLQALKAIIGSARVVALGEPFHGAHEPLAFRNRLIEYLIRDLGFTAVAIESAVTPSKVVDDYVRHGGGDPQQFLPTAISYGFGDFAENLELVRALRRHNQTQRNDRPVRFYGVDLTGSYRFDAGRSLEALSSYLESVDPIMQEAVRQRLTSYVKTFTASRFVTLSNEQKDAFAATLGDLIALLERKRPAYIAASSPDDYAWAVHHAISATQDVAFFRALPLDWDQPPPKPQPPMVEAMEFRDLAIAENVRRILRDQGPEARIVLFAHNNHVRNYHLVGCADHPKRLSNGALAAGSYLRSMFGRDLIIIGTYFGSAPKQFGRRTVPYPEPEAGGIEELLGKAGVPRYVLDLRRLPNDDGLRQVLQTPLRMRTQNIADQCEEVPVGVAFDAVVYLDQVTPSQPLSSVTP